MKTISNEELERRFDEGEDLSEYVDFSHAKQPNKEKEMKRITVDCPAWLVNGLDGYASRVGVTRQSVVKIWLAERLKQEEIIPPAM